jgi:hypothetical protein
MVLAPCNIPMTCSIGCSIIMPIIVETDKSGGEALGEPMEILGIGLYVS